MRSWEKRAMNQHYPLLQYFMNVFQGDGAKLDKFYKYDYKHINFIYMFFRRKEVLFKGGEGFFCLFFKQEEAF